jgi:hypothetical protein
MSLLRPGVKSRKTVLGTSASRSRKRRREEERGREPLDKGANQVQRGRDIDGQPTRQQPLPNPRKPRRTCSVVRHR